MNKSYTEHGDELQLRSVAQSCPTLSDPMNCRRQASLSITNSWSSPKLMSVESVMPSSHLILCRPLLLLPPIPLSIRVFSNGSTLRLRWPKYWSFSFSISPSKEHPGQISFRMDWLDLLAVQGTLKSLLPHHSKTEQFAWYSSENTEFGVREVLVPSETWYLKAKRISLASPISLNFPEDHLMWQHLECFQ